ncbi:MAG TPA: cytochrome c-type biogenesis protein CcmH [Gemmatimonadales bacterium]|nr:cytochrome c-type biogenesis protein CcmH [Gemmatimonadales bacterium]
MFLTARPPIRLTAQSPDSLPGAGPSGRLADPSRAGRPLPPVTAADNDAAIQAIEKQIHCTCGCNQDVYTCRTTDFTCTTSPEMHRQVVALAQAGKTGPEIIDAFVREHGVVILMAPPKRGFNLLGYFVPPAALLVAGALLTVVLRRWSRAAAGKTVVPVARVAATPEELERLGRELERLSH